VMMGLSRDLMLKTKIRVLSALLVLCKLAGSWPGQDPAIPDGKQDEWLTGEAVAGSALVLELVFGRVLVASTVLARGSKAGCLQLQHKAMHACSSCTCQVCKLSTVHKALTRPARHACG
jgi:hypothetical protein